MQLKRIWGYYFITDKEMSKAGNASDVKNAVEAGVGIVQYRNKNASIKERYKEALILKAICKSSGVYFVINDHMDVALAVDADGIHLGQDDMPYAVARKLLGKDKIIGITVHNVAEALDAESKGADYIGVSPIFTTNTKSDAGAACGVEMIAKIKKVCKLPIVAIGGITLDNAAQVIDAGADSICAISSVVSKENVKAEIGNFQKLFIASN